MCFPGGFRERLFQSKYKLEMLSRLQPLFEMYNNDVQLGWKAASEAQEIAYRKEELPEW